MMNKYIVFGSFLFWSVNCFAQTQPDNLADTHVITPEEFVDTDKVDVNFNKISPKNAAKAQLTMNRRLERMYETYSQPQLARYALQIHRAQTLAAQRNGTKPPAPLTREILNDRDKIIEYLKSEYKFEY